MGSIRSSVSSVPRAYLSSCFTVAEINGMAVETQVLRNKDISESVIPLMLKGLEVCISCILPL